MAEYGIKTVPDGMPSDAGTSDKMAPTLADAIAEAMGRHAELERDTHGPGSTIGDLMPVINVTPNLDPGVGQVDTFDQKPGVEAA